MRFMVRFIGIVAIVAVLWGTFSLADGPAHWNRLKSAVHAYVSKVRIYVDNGHGPEPLQVSLEGKEQFQVAPGQVGIIYCQAGDKRITLKIGDEIVFDQLQSLRRPDGGGPVRYLLDPGQANRYLIRPVIYADNVRIALSWNYRTNYKKLVDQLVLVRPAVWTELEGCDFVLDEELPESIAVAEGVSEVTKYQLCRVGLRDYRSVAAMKRRERWTRDEYRQLAQVMERIYSSTAPALPRDKKVEMIKSILSWAGLSNTEESEPSDPDECIPSEAPKDTRAHWRGVSSEQPTSNVTVIDGVEYVDTSTSP